MATVDSLTIYDALKCVDNGEYVIPAFQRDFVWSLPQIEKLWDSILSDYPISIFLFWNIDENNVTPETYFNNFIKEIDFTSAKIPKKIRYDLTSVDLNKTKIAVLDGQQRLTALYLSLFGCASVLPKHARNNYNAAQSKLLIELDEEKLSEEYDPENKEYNNKRYDIRFVEKTALVGPTQFEIKKILEPRFRDDTTREQEFDKVVSGVSPDSKEYAKNILRKLYQKIFVERMIRYIPLVDTKQDDALEVFVRFNYGGTKLKKSEITMAILNAYWPNCKEKFNEVLVGSYEDFGTDFIIRTALMLHSNVLKSSIDQTTANLLKNGWENLKTTLGEVENLLKGFNIKVSRFSSSWNVLLPIIYAVYNQKENLVETRGVRAYLTRAVLFTYFSSGTTNKLSNMKTWLNENDKMFDVAWLDSKRVFEVTDEKIENILNAEKGDRVAAEALFYLNLGWLRTDLEYELDHLHPRARFDKSAPAMVREVDWHAWRKNCDKLPNLWPLNGNDNGKKNDMSLLDFYNSKTDEQQVNFRKQAMIPDGVSLDIKDFDLFFQERADILREKLRALLKGDPV